MKECSHEIIKKSDGILIVRSKYFRWNFFLFFLWDIFSLWFVAEILSVRQDEGFQEYFLASWVLFLAFFLNCAYWRYFELIVNLKRMVVFHRVIFGFSGSDKKLGLLKSFSYYPMNAPKYWSQFHIYAECENDTKSFGYEYNEDAAKKLVSALNAYLKK